MPKLPWRGKVAVVCGATQGLGREIVLALADAGVSGLGIIARSQDQLDDLAQEIVGTNTQIRVVGFAADLTELQAAKSAAATMAEAFDSVDLLIQAVGISARGRLDELTEDDVDIAIDVNVKSSIFVAQAFSELLKPDAASSTQISTRRGGTLVLIGSLASLFAPRFLGAYALAKHALRAVAQQLRLEWADDGKHVMLVCPGPIRRDDSGRRYEAEGGEIPAEAKGPGGGAKLKGLDPTQLAGEILSAAARRKCTLVRPRSARLLQLIQAASSAWGDWVLRGKTS